MSYRNFYNKVKVNESLKITQCKKIEKGSPNNYYSDMKFYYKSHLKYFYKLKDFYSKLIYHYLVKIEMSTTLNYLVKEFL